MLSNLSTSKEPLLQSTPQRKKNDFEIQCILCFSRHIALHFQPMQFAHLADRRSAFYEHKEELFA